jgi:hypothetical protein
MTQIKKDKKIMELNHIRQLGLVAILLAIGTVSVWDQAVFAQHDQTDTEDGVQVLTRGPVHEAFAETVTFDPQPGIKVPKAPPDSIEELPPEQKPEGANIRWIPGYWGWDDERNGFLWVSGVWRAMPPGRQWVPGYWATSGHEYQWTSGYWANNEASRNEYLPEPPETVEVGPNINAPSPDHSWIPGCWIWYHSRYSWRPGYWVEMQPEWLWVPDHYVWTPRGYIFVGGYWDYPVSRRGILFAPVYFDQHVYMRIGFYFSPAFVIDLNVFSDCLFWRRHYNHYYFGDYYDAHYYGKAIYPWFSLHARRYGYDPIYAHQHWMHRHDRQWENSLHKEFLKRRDHEDTRPMSRMAAPGKFSSKAGQTRTQHHAVAIPLDHVVKSKDTSWRFQSLNRKELNHMSNQGQDIGKFREKRREVESKTINTSGARGLEPAGEKLPMSPIISKPTRQGGNRGTPPKRYKEPEPNNNVEPAKRSYNGSFGSPGGRGGNNNDKWREPKHEPKRSEGGGNGRHD